MPKLLTLFAALARHDTNVLKAARFLALFLIVTGVGWLFLLPLDEYSRHTYISENALLPGQVHTYFGGSEHTVFRAYRHEVNNMAAQSAADIASSITTVFQTQGLKTARQPYNFTYAGHSLAGDNAYALLQGPRADATEAMVLMASFRNMDGEINYSGVALILTMARYFKRWSLWSKDILFVITTDSTAGPQAWVSAYHSQHDPAMTAALPIKAGALQGAIALDYPASPAGHRFDKLHIHYDGTNGQQPNLDLLNTLVQIARNQVGITSMIQRMQFHSNSYLHRLLTIFRGVVSQGAGRVTGPHSAFMPFHVDAVTLQTVGDGWHDEMSLGMVVESGTRSINNLLEKLHQSFFFYLLLSPDKFVSIGTYLPSAMLVACSFSITSIALWMQSGKPSPEKPKSPSASSKSEEQPPKSDKQPPAPTETIPVTLSGSTTLLPSTLLHTNPRAVALPIATVTLTHFLGLLPLYFLNTASERALLPTFLGTAALSVLLPLLFAATLTDVLHATPQHYTLVSCFSLLMLGTALATLSTLNFSLGLLVGLCAAPLNFAAPLLPATVASPLAPASERSSERKDTAQTLGIIAVLLAAAPTSVIIAIGALMSNDGVVAGVKELLLQASFAWHVNGTWTAVVVWVVWWPAWMLGCLVCCSRLMNSDRSAMDEEPVKVGEVVVENRDE